MQKFSDFKEYELIAQFYGNRTAQRSGVPLINHIHEGLIILEAIQASHIAQKAYCLHPLVQEDNALVAHFQNDFVGITPQVMMAVMEYRSVANAYLSKKTIQSIEAIRLSPLQVVNDMLIADKVQNRKDFEMYHQAAHPRSEILTQYFKNWLQRLGVSEERYQKLVTLLA